MRSGCPPGPVERPFRGGWVSANWRARAQLGGGAMCGNRSLQGIYLNLRAYEWAATILREPVAGAESARR